MYFVRILRRKYKEKIINFREVVTIKTTKTLLYEKVKESMVSVLPIILIVAVLCCNLTPTRPDVFLCFILGAVMLILGMGLFSVGVDKSMTTIGSKIGTALTKSKNMPLILGISFILGIAITVAEPDLQVLAATVPHIQNSVLLLTVGVGVGIFMAVCMFRIITGANLRYILIACYILIFVLAAFTDESFLGIAFDSGGVTTGPMTVPFILAMGVGVANIRSDSRAEADSFGLVALCSIGPVISVMILGFFYHDSAAASQTQIIAYESTAQIAYEFLRAIPVYAKEMALAMLPIVAIFIVFQIFALHIAKRNVLKILIGFLYTYIGLVLFLTGVNVGFSALGAQIGALLSQENNILLIVTAGLLGWFVISAEPAVGVLEKQIETVSAGAIPGKAIKVSLSVAIAIAMALSMVRVIWHINVLWFLVPGYTAALALSFFVPDIYTAIAFDSGGVASGPMTATFMLSFVMGVSGALGGNILCDAFGVVAMVAMMPLISIQAVGLIYEKKKIRATETEAYGDFDIIELWEDAAL